MNFVFLSFRWFLIDFQRVNTVLFELRRVLSARARARARPTPGGLGSALAHLPEKKVVSILYARAAFFRGRAENACILSFFGWFSLGKFDWISFAVEAPPVSLLFHTGFHFALQMPFIRRKRSFPKGNLDWVSFAVEAPPVSMLSHMVNRFHQNSLDLW